MRKHYKSHWAYYILIKAMILGERIKPGRRAKMQHYHVPIWDIVFDLDGRDKVKSAQETTTSKIDAMERCDGDCFASRVHDVIAYLSSTTTKKHDLPLVELCHTIHPPLYLLGDSHVLSIGWQTLCIQTEDKRNHFRALIPNPVTGLKAWHTRSETRFFTNTNLRINLKRLPPSTKTIIISAGEIDCREGIGGEHLVGYNQSCNDAVIQTAKTYVQEVRQLSQEFGMQILLMPVAPHAHRSQKNGKSMGRAFRRERMKIWNECLRSECHHNSNTESNGGEVFLLDYEEALREPCPVSPVGYVLNKAYNADYTHMNSAFLPLLEAAIKNCGCDINFL